MFFVNVAWLYNPFNETHEDWKNYWSIKFNEYDVRKCARQDFEKFNATHIYDNLKTLNPIVDEVYHERFVERYCFDIPKNKILPEYGDPLHNGNGTFYNKITINLIKNETN